MSHHPPACANCTFFEPDDDTCHSHAPQPDLGATQGQVPWAWPRVNVPGRRNWCGDWEPAVDVTPQRGLDPG